MENKNKLMFFKDIINRNLILVKYILYLFYEYEILLLLLKIK